MGNKWVLTSNADGKPELIDYEQYKRANREKSAAIVISDDMNSGLWNPADDKVYTSKAKFDRAVRENDCLIKGNERLPEHRFADNSDEWAEAVVRACDIHNVSF